MNNNYENVLRRVRDLENLVSSLQSSQSGATKSSSIGQHLENKSNETPNLVPTDGNGGRWQQVGVRSTSISTSSVQGSDEMALSMMKRWETAEDEANVALSSHHVGGGSVGGGGDVDGNTMNLLAMDDSEDEDGGGRAGGEEKGRGKKKKKKKKKKKGGLERGETVYGAPDSATSAPFSSGNSSSSLPPFPQDLKKSPAITIPASAPWVLPSSSSLSLASSSDSVEFRAFR